MRDFTNQNIREKNVEGLYIVACAAVDSWRFSFAKRVVR
jgi:hypothetical protein